MKTTTKAPTRRNIKISLGIHRKLKVLAAQSGIDIQDLADQVIGLGIAKWKEEK